MQLLFLFLACNMWKLITSTSSCISWMSQEACNTHWLMPNTFRRFPVSWSHFIPLILSNTTVFVHMSYGGSIFEPNWRLQGHVRIFPLWSFIILLALLMLHSLPNLLMFFLIYNTCTQYIRHLAFNMAKCGSKVVVSNHRGLGGVAITVRITQLNAAFEIFDCFGSEWGDTKFFWM